MKKCGRRSRHPDCGKPVVAVSDGLLACGRAEIAHYATPIRGPRRVLRQMQHDAAAPMPGTVISASISSSGALAAAGGGCSVIQPRQKRIHRGFHVGFLLLTEGFFAHGTYSKRSETLNELVS